MSQVRRTRIEDYLATIEHICEEGGMNLASTGAIAAAVGVSKGTVSCILKQLAEAALIELVPYQGASLTTAGQKRARTVLRRYRLLELFLSRTLGIDWETVRIEAWRLEPSASEALIDHIDRFLAGPEFDPHGDPIPRTDGTLPTCDAVPLTTCPVGVTVVLNRVKRQSAAVLQFLREAGLAVGSEMLIQDNSTVGGVVVVQSAKGEQALGYPIAAQILVTKAKHGEPS